jgi:TIR domain
MAYDVFISHAHKDKSIADAICEKLESAQVSCWIAVRDVSASEDRTDATRKAIGSSHVVVLVMSENANAAPHVEREIAHAHYTGRSIVPLRLNNTLPRRAFLFYLENVRWFDAFNPPTDDQLEALTARIKSLMPVCTVASNANPFHNATATKPRVKLSNSWIGALQASHYRTLEIFKRVAIAASLFLVAGLFFFASRQANYKHGTKLAQSNYGERSAGSSVSTGKDASTPKTTSTFTRFGLWEPPKTGPTPLAQEGIRDMASMIPSKPLPSATPSPRSDVDQKATDEAKAQDSSGVRTAQEDPVRKSPPEKAVKLALAWESQGPRQQNQDPDLGLAWNSWHQVPEYELRIRTGDQNLGGENWAHYLGFELGSASQKVVKVSLIRLEGETTADLELSPSKPSAIVKIVNHHMTVQKGAWSWTLQAGAPNPTPTPLEERGSVYTPPVAATSAPTPHIDSKATGESKPQDNANLKSAQESPPQIVTPGKSAGLTSAWESDAPRQQYQDPDHNISWRSWQQLPAYEVRTRTGDHYLGGENWAHYLRFELAATSQKVVKVSLISLEGETAAAIELSPTVPDAIVKIINHHMTVQKGAWSWALQAQPYTASTPLAKQGARGTPSTTPGKQLANPTPAPLAPIGQTAAGEVKAQDNASLKPAQQESTRTSNSGLRPQNQDPDRPINWYSWQPLAPYEVKIRTGDQSLGGENWAHYLGFELEATSQKVIKVSLIHLEGEAAADLELAPNERTAVVKIVNRHMTAQKGAWSWTLQETKQNGP